MADHTPSVRDESSLPAESKFIADFRLTTDNITKSFIARAENCMKVEQDKLSNEKKEKEKEIEQLDKKRYRICTAAAKEQFEKDMLIVAPVVSKYAAEDAEVVSSFTGEVSYTIVNVEPGEEPNKEYYFDLQGSLKTKKEGMTLFTVKHSKPASKEAIDCLKEKEKLFKDINNLNEKIQILASNLTDSSIRRLQRKVDGFISEQFLTNNVSNVADAFERMLSDMPVNDFPLLKELFEAYLKEQAENKQA